MNARSPRPPTLEDAIIAALAAGEEETAATMLRRAFGRDPGAADEDLPALLEELAEYYVSLDRPEDALAAAGRALLMTPADATAEEVLRRRCRIAEILLKAGLAEEACAVYASVAEAAPGETWVHEAAGSDYVDAGEHELAFAWLTAGLELAVEEGQRGCIERLRGLRRSSMRALGALPDDLDRRASERIAPSDAHAPDADDILLIDELDRDGVASERTVRLLHHLRRVGRR